MSDNILNHPMLTCSNELATLCNPLERLGITYFGHAHIDNNGNFSALNNNPGFAKHYLENQYYNADIHLAGKDKLGKYICWDSIQRVGRSEKMYTEGIQFGVQHVFTIVEKNKIGTDFYHFANNSPCNSINQIYISNIDLLKLFIQYFNENVSQSKELSAAYEQVFTINTNDSAFEMYTDENFMDNEKRRKKFLRTLQDNKTVNSVNQYYFTHREMECLKLLVKGKTAREISELLGLTKRTVEFYIANIKSKVHVSKKSKLIDKVIDLFGY